MKNVKRVLLKRMKNTHGGRKSSSTSIPPDSAAAASSNAGPPPVTPTTPTASPLRRVPDSVTNSPTPPVVAAQPHEAWTKPVSSAPATSLSGSIPKLSIGHVDDAGPLDRQEMIGITKDVQKFLATISELRLAMEEGDTQQQQRVPRILHDDDDDDSGSEDESSEGRGPGDGDVVVEKLRALIQVVEQCLQSNTGMQSTELTRASQSLLVTYDGCTHNGEKVSACPTCDRAINQLCDVFTHSVSEYMNGDNLESAVMLGVSGVGGGVNTTPSHHARRSQQPNLVHNRGLGMSKSYEQLPRYGSFIDLTQQPVPNEPIIDRIDQALMAMENNVEVTASYIKCRQKYHREILSCLAKRAQLEQRYYHQLNKLVRTTQQSLTELRQQQESLPLLDVFMSALEQDSRYAMNCNTTFNLQVGHKIIEVLNRKVHEGDKMRKTLIQNWQRERRKVMDARNTLKVAKTKYRDLGQELVRVKNLLAAEPFGKQADKMKKQVTDLELRWQESETAYKLAVANCNDCQYQVHATAQKSILCAYRRMVIDFDASLKAGLEHFYQLQVNFFTSLPEPLQHNVEEVQQYEVGREFLGFINRQPQASVELEDYHFEEMDPEAEAFEEGGGDEPTVAGLESPSISQRSSSNDIKSLTERATSPVAAPFLGLWDAVTKSHNDNASPRADKKRPKSIAVLEDVSTPSPIPDSPLHRRNSEKSKAAIPPAMSPAPGEADDTLLSRVARTHTFKRLRTPARCRGCDTYVYFHGFECETCGLACHRKCLSTLAIRCGNKKLPRKMNTFGVGFHAHLKATKRMVPIIVTKCINEMDERGLSTQGLYRISSAKSKMERLCQLFEAGAERVDLSDLQPHLISSCLKLYFRQLPEPLLTFELYHEFIGFAREASIFLPCNFKKASPERELQARDLLQQLRSLITSLPEATQLTLARLMYHLHRVSSPDHVKFNCMPASNLGIVFGPNLLRQEEVISSLAVLANMSYQAKAVEIMVAHAHDIFVVPEEDIKQLEIECEDSDTYTTERPVDAVPSSSPPRVELEPETSPDHSLSNTMEVEDMRATFSEPRTPYNTPPERRKHNVEELHKALEVFGTTSKPKNNVVPPIQASPLLKDSRHWTDSSLETLLPGTVDDDDHSFTEDIMKTLDQRPSFKEILTPVLEFTPDEDYKPNSLSDGEEEDLVIVTATTQHNLEKGRRRRAHSLTKSTSGSDQESPAGQDEDGDVFRHTPPEPTPIHQNSMFTSRSEDNLLQCRTSFSPEEDEEEIRKRNNFEAVIQKYMVESSGRKSAGSSSSDLQEVAMADYKPYLPDLQTILSSSLPSSPRSSIFSNSSSTKRNTPAHSLPRNFSQTTKSHRVPTRQYSEGHIHLERSPMFQIASPPLTSPVSLTSAGKASSQGSFSEGFSEELNEDMGLRRKRESDLVEQRSVEEKEETDGLTDSGVAQPTVKDESQTTDNGVGAEEDEHHDELPLPDNSPARHSLHISYLHSESRDSGLSDSPVPFADYTQIKGCKSSPQRHSAASGLAQTTMHAPPDKMTSTDPPHQLATAGSPSSGMPTHNDEYNERHTSPSLDPALLQSPGPTLEPQSVTSPAPAKPDHLPLFESDSKLDPVEHIRMVSPEELKSTPKRQNVEKFGMKRSQSHGEALSRDSNSSPTFSHQTRHGRLIILADNGKQAEQPLPDGGKTAEEAAGTSKDSSKGKGKRRRKFKSSESLYEASSSPRSHRRTPFFV